MCVFKLDLPLPRRLGQLSRYLSILIQVEASESPLELLLNAYRTPCSGQLNTLLDPTADGALQQQSQHYCRATDCDTDCWILPLHIPLACCERLRNACLSSNYSRLELLNGLCSWWLVKVRNGAQAEAGFRCAAGIACNKMLAKLVGGLHKPDDQTTLPPPEAAAFVASLPARAIPGIPCYSISCLAPLQ